MNSANLAHAFRWFALIFFQVFALNNLHLSGMATPFIYPLFILLLPFTMPLWSLLILSFVTGLTVDIFVGSLGFHAATATFLAYLRPVILNLVSSKGAEGKQIPRIANFGLGAFSMYMLTSLLIYHLFYFFIEIGTFFNPLYTLLKAIYSTGIAVLLVIAIEMLTSRSKARR